MRRQCREQIDFGLCNLRALYSALLLFGRMVLGLDLRCPERWSLCLPLAYRGTPTLWYFLPTEAFLFLSRLTPPAALTRGSRFLREFSRPIPSVDGQSFGTTH